MKPSLGMDFALVAGAYLLGSISWSYLLVWLLKGRDVRTVGSGNAGATNAMRAAGKGTGAAVLLLDMGKGVAAIEVARALAAPPPVVGAAAVAVVLGHVYPVFFGFRGGKGVATSAGAMGALAPLALALTLAVFLLVVLWKRYISLGSVVAGATFPAMVLLGQRLGWERGPADGAPWTLLAAVTLGLVIVGKHLPNLHRIAAGTEPRIGERRPTPPTSPTTPAIDASEHAD
ncbi:MAG TPA: glycerol-3-phosphate 1-O-acyltransferase PlsY [Thermoanaerobaculia bacterium]|nr:glycerol-3-phosphate 1-O-acyltransferase PlsY [Thermoanaerobaculia bacterium]